MGHVTRGSMAGKMHVPVFSLNMLGALLKGSAPLCDPFFLLPFRVFFLKGLIPLL